jgi:hypothetical protein
MVNERDRDVTEDANGLDVEPDVESGRRSMTTTYSNRTSEASEVEYVGKATRHRLAVEIRLCCRLCLRVLLESLVGVRVGRVQRWVVLKQRMLKGRRSWKRRLYLHLLAPPLLR